MPAEKPVPKPMDARRSNKPIMEKRRRARINQCLNELKHLILEALRKDPSRHSKLEKADILEMTVRHLQNVQRQQMALAVASDPSVMSKFRSGFSECATEVSRYVSRIDGVDAGVRQRLLSHLGHCVGGLHSTNTLTTANANNPGSGMGQFPPLHIGVSSHHLNVLPQVPFHLGDLNNNHAGSATARLFSGLSFIPGRLVNAGDFALLVPSQPVNSNLMPMFSPSAASSTPSATITCHSDMNEDEDEEEDEEEEDEEDDEDVHDPTSGKNYHASTTGTLSPVSITSTCTSGSSAFSPPIRESSPDVKVPPEPSSDGSDLTDTQSAGTSSHEDSSQPSTSADTDRMWRPW